MMESPRSEEEKITKDIRNLFRLKKEVERIKDLILRNIKNLLEYENEEENYYKPVRVNNFWSNNYIEYKSNNGKSRIACVEEYLDKIRSNLKVVSTTFLLVYFVSLKEGTCETRKMFFISLQGLFLFLR